MEKNHTTVFSITAHIDLLGFSSHLVLSSYDLRTKIGVEAIERLKILEEATSLLEEEQMACDTFYPDGFRFLRFNDSLILGIDIREPLLPLVGNPNGRVDTFSLKEIHACFGDGPETAEEMRSHFDKEAFKVAQFLGIVSRVHNFINTKEFEMHMPGCRTVVASGLRHKFIKKDGSEDYYSANFSLSNAYIANEMGSKNGFIGNKCYVENNVASICGLNPYSKRALGFTKFLINDPQDDPFNGHATSLTFHQTLFDEAQSIKATLFNKNYLFREINTVTASTLQLLPTILKFSSYEGDDKLLCALMRCYLDDNPNLDVLNRKETGSILNDSTYKFPLLFLNVPLQEKISKTIQDIEEIIANNGLDSKKQKLDEQ